MITAEEAENPEMAEKAEQIIKWIDNRQGDSQDFMRVNSSPGNSTVLSSNSSNTSDEGFQSISDTLDDSDVTEEVNCRVGAESNEAPTLRRKKNTRQGPRVTRNLSDEAVLSELQDICQGILPWETYEKVGFLSIFCL